MEICVVTRDCGDFRIASAGRPIREAQELANSGAWVEQNKRRIFIPAREIIRVELVDEDAPVEGVEPLHDLFRDCSIKPEAVRDVSAADERRAMAPAVVSTGAAMGAFVTGILSGSTTFHEG